MWALRMNSSFEERFCGANFWSSNLTWNSPNPDFTDCFHKTILSWCPSLMLAIFSINEFLLFKSNKNKPISWNFYNLTKVRSRLTLASVTSEWARQVCVCGGAPGAPLSILALEPNSAQKSCSPERWHQFQLIWSFFRIFF